MPQAMWPRKLHSESLPLWQATADPHLCRRLIHRSSTVCVGPLGPGVHKVLFEPSKCLWQVWGLILNSISPLLPSCWGFCFVLECRVSFLCGTQHSPVDGCSTESCNFGVFTGEDEWTSFYSTILPESWASMVAQLIKNQSATQESWVQSLGWKAPLEKGKAVDSRILDWRILVRGVAKSQTQLSNFHFQPIKTIPKIIVKYRMKIY